MQADSDERITDRSANFASESSILFVFIRNPLVAIR